MECNHVHFSTIFKHSMFFGSISILCYIALPFRYILEANISFLFYSTTCLISVVISYFTDYMLHQCQSTIFQSVYFIIDYMKNTDSDHQSTRSTQYFQCISVNICIIYVYFWWLNTITVRYFRTFTRVCLMSILHNTMSLSQIFNISTSRDTWFSLDRTVICKVSNVEQ